MEANAPRTAMGNGSPGGPSDATAPAAHHQGAAGLLRRWARSLPEGEERRWIALMAARRVEALERHLGGLLARPLRERGLEGVADRVERNPLAAVAGVLVGGWLVRRLLD